MFRMVKECAQTENPPDIDRKHARAQMACSLTAARKIIDGMDGSSADEYSQIKARLLIDVAAAWRWLHDGLS
jgi:hypothetical protein